MVLLNSPTFKNKLINTGQDLAVISNNASANNQSLASRLISYKNAIEICNQTSWLFGCGLGDINDLNTQIFKQTFPDVSKPILPHNQFLFLLAATGITGLLFFSMSFFYPLWYFRKRLNPALYGIYLLLFFAFQVEPVLQTQLGVAFSLFFILMGIQMNLPFDSITENTHEN
jgi:O-antigen ligase